ncbi:hypothetical protein C0V70_05950 [Bacteriovorax stolpii]|uniref:Uncharacterized protein n=1 Tax=Bacteriovorax stolpii TaxID=960 RepID=A0A2K9NSD6_BACTC|nr:hypothetical protein [Bacteriovorax stolpii]AUN97664.1 hypothetical protein C0V70_05950 [Bacteriovorax stolpii]TDP52846.1 hypothetical protein C8D79_2613 [Bacteriovorax stolpii]
MYETLILKKGNIENPKELEKELLEKIFKILANPPFIKVDEADIAPNYVYKFPLIINLFDWSHMLHQFVLDVLATSEDRGPKMINRINEIYGKYKSNKPVLITDECKSMLFMDGHYFSKSFRKKFPSFNLLIWSYHWFQIRLYEDLLLPTKMERDVAVANTIAQFKFLISDLPDSADFDMMPETAVEAPTFAKLFPKIPAAFDNNHMLHDIVSDMITSEKVQLEKLRGEALRMGRMAQDPEAFKTTSCNQYDLQDKQ